MNDKNTYPVDSNHSFNSSIFASNSYRDSSAFPEKVNGKIANGGVQYWGIYQYLVGKIMFVHHT